MGESMTAQLPQGWVIEEEEEVLPDGWSVEGEAVSTKDKRCREDFIPEVIEGYEPDFSEEMERWGSYGERQGLKGMASGLTFGLSEYIPGMKAPEGAGGTISKTIGSLAPL